MTRLSRRTATTTKFSPKAARNRQRKDIANIRSDGLLPRKVLGLRIPGSADDSCHSAACEYRRVWMWRCIADRREGCRRHWTQQRQSMPSSPDPCHGCYLVQSSSDASQNNRWRICEVCGGDFTLFIHSFIKSVHKEP